MAVEFCFLSEVRHFRCEGIGSFYARPDLVLGTIFRFASSPFPRMLHSDC